MAKKSIPQVLRLDGEITDASAKALREQIEAVPEGEQITLRINSPGGSIFAGQSLVTEIRKRSGGIFTICESLAASMASVIFALGSKRTMASGSRLMIHKPWGGITGESNDLRRQADLLDSLEADLVAIYGNATGLDAARVGEMLAAETWLTADEAKALGFCTEITTGGPLAHIPQAFLTGFTDVPAELLEQTKPVDTLPVNVIELQGAIGKLRGDLQARTVERDDARASLASTKFLLNALKKSYGLMAASVVPDVHAEQIEGDRDPIMEAHHSLTGPAATSHYERHRSHILANAAYVPVSKR